MAHKVNQLQIWDNLLNRATQIVENHDQHSAIANELASLALKYEEHRNNRYKVIRYENCKDYLDHFEDMQLPDPWMSAKAA